MKTINILYPIVPNISIGGLKILYDYSNMLIADGYDVTITYAAYFEWIDSSLYRKLKCCLKYLYAILYRKYRNCSWYNLDKRVHERYVWDLSYKRMDKSDVYIATAVTTAPYLLKFPVSDKSKFYFIQDYETFICSDETKIRETYHYPFQKIVVSRWLGKIINEENESCDLVVNGFDFNEYSLSIPIEKKDRYAVSLMYHIRESKDVITGIKALYKVKDVIPELKVNMFGAYDAPKDLPSWITYYKSPSLEEHNKINNESAIYIGTSKKEGFGLTVGEAMMCGQAVICTDTTGYREMAEDGETAVLVPIQNPTRMADAIVDLIQNDKKRFKIAENGYKYIKSFDKNNSYKNFKSIIDRQG